MTALKINPDPEFLADVQLTVPGQPDPVTVGITFRYFTLKQMAAIRDELKKEKSLSDADFLDRLIVSWRGFDQEYSKETLEKFLENYPTAAGEIVTAYNKHLLVSRVKN